MFQHPSALSLYYRRKDDLVTDKTEQEAAEVNRLLQLGTERMRPKAHITHAHYKLGDLVLASLHVGPAGETYLELSETADRPTVVLAIVRAAFQLVLETETSTI